MYDGHWHDGGGWGSWWLMAIMMVIFWVAVAAVIITLLRRPGHAGPPAEMHPPAPQVSTAEDILAERLARGEIEPQEYRERLEALRSSR